MKTKKIIAMLLMCAMLCMSANVTAGAEEAATAAAQTTETMDSTQDMQAEASTTQEDSTEAAAAATTADETQEAAVKAEKKAAKKAAKKTAKGSAETYTKKELRYMAAIIYCEAGNQSYAGKLAVGIVVKNRMESKKFPNSIKGVLYQRYQFTPARNGSLSRALRVYDKNGFETKQYSSCLKAAKEALSGVKTVKVGGKKRNMKGYYFFSRYVSGCRLRIGAHMFK